MLPDGNDFQMLPLLQAVRRSTLWQPIYLHLQQIMDGFARQPSPDVLGRLGFRLREVQASRILFGHHSSCVQKRER